jgi:hypothetical protein
MGKVMLWGAGVSLLLAATGCGGSTVRVDAGDAAGQLDTPAADLGALDPDVLTIDTSRLDAFAGDAALIRDVGVPFDQPTVDARVDGSIEVSTDAAVGAEDVPIAEADATAVDVPPPGDDASDAGLPDDVTCPLPPRGLRYVAPGCTLDCVEHAPGGGSLWTFCPGFDGGAPPYCADIASDDDNCGGCGMRCGECLGTRSFCGSTACRCRRPF